MRRLGLLALGLALVLPASADAAPLKVGVGRADITPPTGYYMMGWVRSDAKTTGQNTRLWARVIVLDQGGGHKVALVAEDLNGIPGGVLADAVKKVSGLGFSQRNVLDSASHTHAAPSGFYNFSTFNTVFMTNSTPTDFNLTGDFDSKLYRFEVDQLAGALRRANRNLRPGSVGWGFTRLNGVTMNRSIEAHLADHGIFIPFNTGNAKMDPDGIAHTIDDEVNVLRVDQRVGGRDVPVGIWSTFANHGTVNQASFHYYNEDHHGAATHLTERAIRRAGRVPRSQDVVAAYGNTDEGDQSAGLTRTGPAAADWVGQVESEAFMRAWRKAGSSMSGSPRIRRRWTRVCYCGQATSQGPVDSTAIFGAAQLTGSEEGRGPLYDNTKIPLEGNVSPIGFGPQGHKVLVTVEGLDVPKAVPLMALRIGSRLIVSIPGEMTVEMGRRVRAAVLHAAAGSGIKRVVISGLANEYLDYFTTPQEYERQHYEGASTAFGEYSSILLQDSLVDLAHRMASGTPSPKPYPYDPINGRIASPTPFSTGAASATIASQPQTSVERLGHPRFSWRGGLKGADRPVGKPFVNVQRHTAAGWRTVDSDLGLAMLWSVDSDGVYTAEWEPPLSEPPGHYRFLISANRYLLPSRPFKLTPTAALTLSKAPAGPGRVGVTLDYPRAQVNKDLTFRPAHARSGHVAFRVGNRTVVVSHPGPKGLFAVRAAPGQQVTVTGTDRFGNRAASSISFNG